MEAFTLIDIIGFLIVFIISFYLGSRRGFYISREEQYNKEVKLAIDKAKKAVDEVTKETLEKMAKLVELTEKEIQNHTLDK